MIARPSSSARLVVLVAGLAACLAAPAPGQDTDARTPSQPDRARVHLIATGGTISAPDGAARLGAEEIAALVPGIDDRVQLSFEQFTNIPSGHMTPDLWLGLARTVRRAFDGRSDLAGVVITHGTDTMEETAYFLDLVLGEERPVILTGAMRNPSRLSSDGPANLRDAVRLAAHPESRGRGVLLVMNEAALPAREATKLHTGRVDAFEAPGRGPLALLDADTVVFLEPRPARAAPLLDPGSRDSLPRVDIVFSYPGSDGALVDAAVAAGARGIVIATMGRGGLTPGQQEALERALRTGVWVVRSSRTLSGRVPVGSDGERMNGWSPGRGVAFGADDLTPQKARVLLMLALATWQRPEPVLDAFRTR